MMMLQFERIDKRLVHRQAWIVEVLRVTSFRCHERVARGIARQAYARLPCLALSFHLVGTLTLMIDAAEIRDDDRHGQSNDQYTAQTAHATDDFTGPRDATSSTFSHRSRLPGLRYDITVARREREKRVTFQGRLISDRFRLAS